MFANIYLNNKSLYQSLLIDTDLGELEAINTL